MSRYRKGVCPMSKWRIAGLIAAAVALILVADNYPDIQRYIKIELM